MLLHVLTAVTRPENLGRVAASLCPAGHAGVEIEWHRLFDPERQHIGGQALKNAMLDACSGSPGWAWILDDDNCAHPDFFRHLAHALTTFPETDLVVFAQRLPDGLVRAVGPECLKENLIDAAQVVARRSWVGDRRLPEAYTGDGAWIEALAQGAKIVYVHDPVTYYNRLR